MKKIQIAGAVLAVLAFLYAIPTLLKTETLSAGKELTVLLVYNPGSLRKTPAIRDAYESVLQEEGVPYKNLNVYQLITMSASDLARNVPVIIMPDSILQNVPEHLNAWAKEYLGKGGNIAVIYDAGVKNQEGYFLSRSAFADITGLNYITYAGNGASAYDHGSIRFTSEASRDFFQIPMGKTDDLLGLSGYGYVPLEYPIARNEPIRDVPESAIYAYGITEKNEKFPAITLAPYEKGSVLYVNLPLGYLKANADDLPLRSILRTFLFKVVGIPRIMNVEGGHGGIVINWHIDSNVEHTTLPAMEKMGLLRKELPASFHITAGDFCNQPGDDAGFDACGKGRHLVELLRSYGTIGSHGGWGHNWFANGIQTKTFRKKQIRENIIKNNKCLEKIVGYKIIEYSAPAGVHPQPTMTELLEDLGFIAYYSTGDTGSAPNRTFFNGTMVSDKVIAFPVMPFGRSASLYEMHNMPDKRKDREVRKWFFDLLSYVAKNRTIRLFYSHPYNIEYYPGAVKAFIDRVETMQQSNTISVSTMSGYAKFFLRFLKTTYSFSREGKQLIVSLKNPEGLAGICIALPKKNYQKPIVDNTTLKEDDHVYYLTVVSNEKRKIITVDAY